MDEYHTSMKRWWKDSDKETPWTVRKTYRSAISSDNDQNKHQCWLSRGSALTGRLLTSLVFPMPYIENQRHFQLLSYIRLKQKESCGHVNWKIMLGNHSDLINCRIAKCAWEIKNKYKREKKDTFSQLQIELWTTEYNKEIYQIHAQNSQWFSIYMIDQTESQFMWHKFMTVCHQARTAIHKH